MATDPEKLCGPQNSDEETPSSNWPLSQLREYALTKNGRIENTEESLAVLYWQLGNSLKLARCNFSRGQWSPFLKELGIEATRSSKAIAIYRTFSNPIELQGKSVDAAYRQRKRKKSARLSTTDQNAPISEDSDGAIDGRTTLQQFLVRLREQGEDLVHEAAFAEPTQAASLMELLNSAMLVLQEIQRHLQQQARTS